MTFDQLYTDLQKDPEFGHIKHRREHFRKTWNAILSEAITVLEEEVEDSILEKLEKLKA